MYRRLSSQGLIPVVALDQAGHLLTWFQMTPNLGQGGSCAIESAAALSNAIVDLAENPQRQNTKDIEDRLYLGESHKRRIRLFVTISETVTRFQALERKIYEVIGPFIVSQFGDAFADLICDLGAGGKCISFLPVPQRATKGSMPFGERHDIGAPTLPSGRILSAIPLALCLFYTLVCSTDSGPTRDHLNSLSVFSENAIFQVIWSMESARFCNAATLMGL